MAKSKDDVQAYLARIRRTIAASEGLVSKAELRIAETDRLLAEQGLTREQLAGLKLTPEQRRAVDAELARRGLPPLEDEEEESPRARAYAEPPRFDAGDVHEDLENRKRKFGAMMHAIRL